MPSGTRRINFNGSTRPPTCSNSYCFKQCSERKEINFIIQMKRRDVWVTSPTCFGDFKLWLIKSFHNYIKKSIFNNINKMKIIFKLRHLRCLSLRRQPSLLNVQQQSQLLVSHRLQSKKKKIKKIKHFYNYFTKP